MKKILFIFSMLLAMGLTSACSSDDDKLCYIGEVKYIDSVTGSVQAVLVEVPDVVGLSKGSEIIFIYTDLSNVMPQVGDVIKFRIIDYSQIKDPNGPGLMLRYVCKVKPYN